MKNYLWLIALLTLQLGACTVANHPTDRAPSDNAQPKQAEAEKPAIPSRPFSADSFHDLLVAEFAVRRNQFDVALGHYVHQAHQTRDPGVTARATRLAQYIKAQNAALDMAQLWAELEPDSAEAQYTTATLLAQNKQPLQALEHMERVLNAGGATNFTAIVASSLNMPKLSQQLVASAIDGLISRHPQYGQLYVSRAIMEQSHNKPSQALASVRKGIALDNTDLQAVIIETRLLQQMGRDDEAFVRLEAIQQQYPDNRRLRLQYARLLLKKDLNKAREQFEYLLASTPNEADLLMSLALINTELNDYPQAKQYFKRALATNTRNNEALYYLAQIAEREDLLDEAIARYQAISLGDDYIAASNRMAELYSQQGDDDAALAMLQQRRQQHPELALRFYLLEAELLFNSQHYEQCHALLTEALNLHPEQGNLLYMRSLVSERRNDFALMEQDLRSIITQDPQNVTALNALGYVLANRGVRLEEAFELINQALSLKPNDPAILDSLGWVEFKRGNYARAVTLLEKAYAAFPDPEVASHLGEVLWTLNKQEQAQQIWQQGLEKNPGNPIIESTMQRLLNNSGNSELTTAAPPANSSP
ncbi:tetratricopeptide repeat protein [Dasania sp. GY-MA-18]|uniref:Tetratricopeptide repeat protein n=1 Tax=Dasania phycosphaerae TaxID=2950436 RepID=A0A9J6RI29_9GAMM|nr:MULTISPECIES: tetratricopeptide repeat protein [Dasania]MCR8921492.1 tetratricopeptide repeat protein [Dasania sp. GY-MA-18]MCZ0863920.1 tetratricopeptide repeat protein [Dasania phycosphaerae]MCZ0867648.1 tetratricopeptide repeat protein [Dasania phycosphaerae]